MELQQQRSSKLRHVGYTLPCFYFPSSSNTSIKPKCNKGVNLSVQNDVKSLYFCKGANATISDIWRHFLPLNSYPISSSFKGWYVFRICTAVNVFWRSKSWLVVSDVKSVNTSLSSNQLLGAWCNIKRCIWWISKVLLNA